ncbi:MAG: hypothetical protein AAF218_04515 [Pseudomonadota bacterium]
MNKFKEHEDNPEGSNTPQFMISPDTSHNDMAHDLDFIKIKKNFNLSFANSDKDSTFEEKTSQVQGVSTISNFQLLSPREQYEAAR